MATHTARLIFTIIFLIFAISGVVTGFWFAALFWALVTMAVGYPFVRGGRIDLDYDDTPTRLVFVAPPGPAGAAPMGTGMPPMYEAM